MKICLGIERGSTRIKTVLINELGKVLSVGVYSWQDHLEDGFWSYKLILKRSKLWILEKVKFYVK